MTFELEKENPNRTQFFNINIYVQFFSMLQLTVLSLKMNVHIFTFGAIHSNKIKMYIFVCQNLQNMKKK
jgi:hypothetical protein